VIGNIFVDMKFTRLTVAKGFVCLLILMVGTAWAQADAEKEVRNLERAWLNAYETHDAKAMDEIVGDEFFIVFRDGRKQTKPELMAQIKRPITNPNRTQKFRTEDVKAKVDGNTVVLTGRVITELIQDGKIASTSEDAYVDTYVKRNGRWQVIESHLTEPKTKVK
jgi:uncharacterized protein (TIGR02246 family)